ncbi:dihydrofolate reductase [Microbacterium resistens]|uniref:Dihydrofolate reductase n=1 Tax=Microbacterium resistens TaxID=156977 RepID=A0ABU1SBQ6_9MICO|nr:dihydrofolate reductase family protein [Microbacterium resistens]MDR6867031.1 dihydrofolate reductase [Microbacterium resistens]
MRELTYYVAVSLDGFIAGPGGEFDAFLAEGDHMSAINERYSDTVASHAAEMYGVVPDGRMFDTVLMGWNTYAVGLPFGVSSPYRHLRQVVLTSRSPDPADGVEFTDRDAVQVVRELKSEAGAGIWLCGGGALAASLADEIDHLVLKVNPVLFGDGVRLFGPRGYAPAAFTRTGAEAFESGVVLVEYRRS